MSCFFVNVLFHVLPLQPQDFCRLYGIRQVSRESCVDHAPARRHRLLSENDGWLGDHMHACSVEDVLRLLQLLYAISRDGSIQNNITSMIIFLKLLLKPFFDDLPAKLMNVS